MNQQSRQSKMLDASLLLRSVSEFLTQPGDVLAKIDNSRQAGRRLLRFDTCVAGRHEDLRTVISAMPDR